MSTAHDPSPDSESWMTTPFLRVWTPEVENLSGCSSMSDSVSAATTDGHHMIGRLMCPPNRSPDAHVHGSAPPTTLMSPTGAAAGYRNLTVLFAGGSGQIMPWAMKAVLVA